MRYFGGAWWSNHPTIANPKIKDLCDLTEEDLMKIRNLGLKSQLEIKNKLESLGLHLKELGNE